MLRTLFSVEEEYFQYLRRGSYSLFIGGEASTPAVLLSLSIGIGLVPSRLIVIVPGGINALLLPTRATFQQCLHNPITEKSTPSLNFRSTNPYDYSNFWTTLDHIGPEIGPFFWETVKSIKTSQSLP